MLEAVSDTVLQITVVKNGLWVCMSFRLQFVSADKLQTLMNILHNCLSGSAGDEARVALGFAKFVFTFPTMPINAAGPRAQLQKQLAELVDAMLSSPGRLPALTYQCS